MWNMENYYEILEVKNDASDEVIKAAYKALIKKYHPDNGGIQDPSGEKMRMVNEAYVCLSDPVKRKQYDQKIQSETHKAEKKETFESYKQSVEPEPVNPRNDKEKSLLSQIVSGMVAGVRGAMDCRQADMENAYFEASSMTDYTLIREYRDAVGAKRNGYGKELETRGYLVKDSNGRWHPTEKYKNI